VVLQCEDHDSETAAKTYLDQQTERCVVKSKSAQKDEIELNLEIRLKDDNTDFINALAEMPGVHSAVLVSYNGDYMG
jgi:L-lactate utilization protein LutB